MMSRGGAFYEPDLEIRRLEAELAAGKEVASALEDSAQEVRVELAEANADRIAVAKRLGQQVDELAAAEERATGLLAQRDEERGANFELRRELAAAKAQIESLLALHVCD